MSNGAQKNFCEIQYRYKAESDSDYSEWITILNANDLSGNNVETPALLEGTLLTTVSYSVEVRAVDYIGNASPSTPVIVPTDAVYWHRDGARNALGLGKYNEHDNALDSAWDFHMNGHKITGLPDPVLDSDAVSLGFLKQFIVQYMSTYTLTLTNIGNTSMSYWVDTKTNQGTPMTRVNAGETVIITGIKEFVYCSTLIDWQISSSTFKNCTAEWTSTTCTIYPTATNAEANVYAYD